MEEAAPCKQLFITPLQKQRTETLLIAEQLCTHLWQKQLQDIQENQDIQDKQENQDIQDTQDNWNIQDTQRSQDSQDPENGDAAHCGTTLHRPVVEPLEEPEDSEYGDTAHCGTALHRPVVETVEEQEILMQGRCSLQTALHRPVASSLKEAAKNAVAASQIVGAAKLAVTPGQPQWQLQQKQQNNKL